MIWWVLHFLPWLHGAIKPKRLGMVHPVINRLCFIVMGRSKSQRISKLNHWLLPVWPLSAFRWAWLWRGSGPWRSGGSRRRRRRRRWTGWRRSACTASCGGKENLYDISCAKFYKHQAIFSCFCSKEEWKWSGMFWNVPFFPQLCRICFKAVNQ